VAPSLTRGRVCNLLLLLVVDSEVPFESESRGTQDHILMSQFFRLPQPGGPGPRIYIPQERGLPNYTPGHWVPFSLPLTIRRAKVEVFSSAFTGRWRKGQSQSQSYLTAEDQLASMSWCQER
jgi:hypothetical protein